MSFFVRVRSAIKQMWRADSRKFEEAATHSQVHAAHHMTVHRTLGNLR